MLILRIALFYLLLALVTIVWFCVGLVASPFMSHARRYHFVVANWCNAGVWLAKVCIGLNYRVTGAENIPDKPCVIVAKHQSTWETLFLSGYFSPLTQVLKRELLRIPFFGWAMYLSKPIAIDRGSPKQALRHVSTIGAERLAQGQWVLIFPEGTRTQPGQTVKFSRSGASLAANAGLPLLPIAHNAGSFWPKNGWGKKPGTIDVVIGPLMYAESNSPSDIAALNNRAEAWINETVARLEQNVR